MTFKIGQTFLSHKDIYRYGWLCHKRGAHRMKLVGLVDKEYGYFVNVPDPIDYGAMKMKYEHVLAEWQAE